MNVSVYFFKCMLHYSMYERCVMRVFYVVYARYVRWNVMCMHVHYACVCYIMFCKYVSMLRTDVCCVCLYVFRCMDACMYVMYV